MDTEQALNEGLATIKGRMPETYKSIQAKAVAGKGAFSLVRRGLRGEPNCFWACERGQVVGTPFTAESEIAKDVAQLMVQFAPTFVCIWGKDGAN